MMRRALALIACGWTGLAAAAQSLNCPEIPRAEGKYQWVSELMIYNGLPMQVLRFDGKQSPEDVLAFYRRQWAGEGPMAPMEYPAGRWQAIAAARSGCFYTVQVQAAGSGSTGFMAVSGAPGGPQVSDGKALPMLPGSSVINDIEHRDTGKTGRTVMVTNGFSPAANADFYRGRLKDEGWRPISDMEMRTKKGPGVTMVLKRDLAELSLVITRQGQTTSVLANFLDNP